MLKLSVYMVACNEEKRIERTLKAIQPIADELIIVDSGSTDKTKEIALKYGAKFVEHPWESYAAQKAFAENLCQYDWRLQLDADETLSPELIKEILEFKKSTPRFQIYRLYIADMFPGFKKPNTLVKKYYIPRLYHKNAAKMPAKALTEDRLCFDKGTPLGGFKGLVYHYSYQGISHHIRKLNYYSDEVQKTVLKKGRHYSLLRLITEFPRQFFIYYFIKRHCFNGFWGFSYAMNLAFCRYLKIAKALEQERLSHVKDPLYK